jgi:hypothetical protein
MYGYVIQNDPNLKKHETEGIGSGNLRRIKEDESVIGTEDDEDIDEVEVISDDDEQLFDVGDTAMPRRRQHHLGVLGKRNFFALREILDSQQLRIANIGVDGNKRKLVGIRRDTVRFIRLDDFVNKSADELSKVMLERIPHQIVEYFNSHNLTPSQAGIQWRVQQGFLK